MWVLNKLVISSFFFILWIVKIDSQYSEDSPQYLELRNASLAVLKQSIREHPDVVLDFYPERAQVYSDDFRFSFPQVEDFRINMLVDPCRGRDDPACCLNVFGTAEYPKLKMDGLEPERENPKNVIANDSDIQANYDLVFEDGSLVPVSSTRGADDELIIDYDCDDIAVPYARCRGKNFAHRRADYRPACLDNNQTVDVMAGCQTPEGEHRDYCVALAYTQNAYIPLCGGDYEDESHCGTFLEIHQVQGTDITEENTKIAEVEITTKAISGYYTTTLPLTWMGDSNKVLCTYIEPYIRIGSSVFITRAGGTPTCCCPRPFKDSSRIGSFQCPISATGRGPFAAFYKTLKEEVETEPATLEFPRCHSGLNEGDQMMCGEFDAANSLFFTKACPDVYTNGTGLYTSSLMDGVEYVSPCPYFSSCAVTEEIEPTSGDGKCKGEDSRFTFIGRVGRVVAIYANLDPIQYDVTFNDGRTSYRFTADMIKLEPGKSMYEIWWVVRTPNEFVVQKRKGFNVSSPQCTFDVTNDRYFPYAVLDSNGIPQD